MYESENTFELNPEMTSFESEHFEFGQSESGEVFNESEMMELTAELLEVTNEAELDRFLGGLIRRVGGAIGKVVKSPIGQANVPRALPPGVSKFFTDILLYLSII